jgi:hypothetical protein
LLIRTKTYLATRIEGGARVPHSMEDEGFEVRDGHMSVRDTTCTRPLKALHENVHDSGAMNNKLALTDAPADRDISRGQERAARMKVKTIDET